MAKPAPNLAAMKAALRETAAPATHAEAPSAEKKTEKKASSQRHGGRVQTKLIGAHLSPDVSKQLNQIALDEDTDVKTLLIEAINLLFKTRGKPQIAADPLQV